MTASDRPRSKVARVGGSTKRKPELITRAGNIRDLGSMDPSNAAFTVSSLYFNRPRFRAIKASPTDSFALSTVSPPSPPFFFQLSSREGHILGMEINHRKFFSSLRNSRRCAKIKDLYATEFPQINPINVDNSFIFEPLPSLYKLLFERRRGGGDLAVLQFIYRERFLNPAKTHEREKRGLRERKRLLLGSVRFWKAGFVTCLPYDRLLNIG